MDWSIDEVNLIIEDYFAMLRDELTHHAYNKTTHRKNLLPFLNGRSEGAIERKHQNISAILIEMQLPYIRGYKPLSGYQQILKINTADYVEKNINELEGLFDYFVTEKPSIDLTDKFDFREFLNDDPVVSEFKEEQQTYKPVKINFLEKEQNNRLLGEAGEKLIVEYEKWRLKKEGKENLIKKIEWISKTRGDGAGFDILSKNANGTDRFIEVKTTRLAKETPIFLTKTELSFATSKGSDFYLYRVYDFSIAPQFFFRQGRYNNYCQLQPESYKGFFF